MADIERFTARAPRLANLEPPTDNGAAAALASVAQVSSRLASRFGQMADKSKVAEEQADAARNEMAVEMPGVEFSYDGSSATTSATGPSAGKIGELENYIRQAAAARGIDPNVAVRVAKSEGLAPGVWQSNVVKNGRRERSYGPFQLYVDGGLGNEFQRLTGKSPADPSTVHQQIDFALDKATQLGWTPWYGAARVGIGPRDGLAGARAIGIATAAPNPSIAGTGSTIDFSHGEAVAGAPPAALPPTAPGGAVRVTLTGHAGPLRLKKAGTLAGDAYNAAALDIHMNRLDTAMRGQMEAIALQHENDPSGLAPALDALRAGYLDGLPAPAAAALDQSFQRQKFALERAAVTKFNADLESANLAAFEENVSARMNSAFRLAAKAGLDKAADAVLSAELGAFDAQVDASPLSPLQKSRIKTEAKNGVISARILGGFENAGDEAGRAAYLKAFQDEWREGKGTASGLDLATYDKVNGEMVRRISADQTAAAKRVSAAEKAIDDQIDFMKKGWPVPDAARKALSDAVSATGNAALAKNLDFLDNLAAWQKAHVAQRPEVLDAQIEAMRARIMKDGATEAALTTLDVAEGLRDEMAKGLSTDPLTWANRAGVAQVEPLDFGSAQGLAATLGDRVADAEAVARHYGIPPRYFTAAEADALKKTFKATPLALPSLISGLSAGLGRATPAALAEISKDAPLLAHVAGLQHMTGDQRVAVEIAEVLDRRNQPGYKENLPAPAKLQAAAASAIGPALVALPRTQGGAIEAATALFEARAVSRGIDIASFDQDGDAARELFLDAIDDVLGATERGGVKYGGLTTVNGMATIAPPGLPANSLDAMLEDLTADDLIFQGGIGTANGVPIRVEELRGAKLVMTAPGRYRMALGDVAGGDPRYVPDARGGYFELDMTMLAKTQDRRFRPGSSLDGLFMP